MKSAVLPIVTLLLCLNVVSVSAQDDTAYHRKIYGQTNDNLKSYKKAKASFTDGELTFALEAWLDGGNVRRIDSSVPGEDGDGSEEYYFDDGQLLFAFRYYWSMAAEKGAKRQMVEDRFYFKDGKLFKWIGTDKKLVSKDDESFKLEEERITSNASAFVGALKQKSAAPSTIQVTKGKFKRIDEGDYGHWVMTDAKGEEVSFFILQADASVDKVLENPGSYVDKACTVKWKKNKENIPEAGGDIEVEQILSVEWDANK